MTRLILDSGEMVGITWLKVMPNTVIQVKTVARDGYAAIQLGTGESKRYLKPQTGHLKNADAKVLKEIKVDSDAGYQPGAQLDVTLFQVGDRIMVTGISKGKGFAGTIRRHHFKSGPGSHGHDHHRQPGSIGAMGIARVGPGHRMAGHLGADKVTTKNLRVVAVEASQQRLAVKGSVPGANKGWVLIKKHA